jgi:regulator of protease activity HflC (stomatin/prohibitin superfamily)
MALTLIALVAVMVVCVAWLASGFRVIHPDHGAVIERFGRYRKTVGAGPHLTLRFVHTVHQVDLRETVVDVPTDLLTADDVTLGAHLAVFAVCTDPRRFLYEIADFQLAVARLAATRMRRLARELTLDDLLDDAGQSTAELARSLDDVTRTWGAQVNRVEMAGIDLPAEIAGAMKKRAVAERHREVLLSKELAAVEAAAAKAEGELQARLRRSEVRQALVAMAAEREATAVRVMADAERYRLQALARAQAESMRIVSGAIHQGWSAPDRAGVKYLEVQGSNGNGEHTEPAPLPPPKP